MRSPRSSRLYALGLGLGLGLATLVAASCTLDPVGSAQEREYEKEPDFGLENYPNTEFHRPGQDCIACHGPRGSAKNKFEIAGTVFWGTCVDPEAGPDRCKRVGANRAEVRIIDANGRKKCIHTNCVGNFYIREERWSPVSNAPKPEFPLLASVRKVPEEGGEYEKVMTGHIGRWGSCNACHRTSPYWNSAGQIHLVSVNDEIPPSAAVDEAACKESPQPTDENEPQCEIAE